MNNLKELRKKAKLTQEELSENLNKKYKFEEKYKTVSKMNISNWENGKHEIKSEKAQILADYFDVSVAYLLGYTEKEEKYYDDEFLLIGQNEEAVSSSVKRGNELIEQYKEKLISDFEFFLRAHDLLVSDYDITNLLNFINYYNVNNMKHPLFERALQERGSDQSKNFLKDNGYSKLGDLFQSSKAFDDFKKSKGYDGETFL